MTVVDGEQRHGRRWFYGRGRRQGRRRNYMVFWLLAVVEEEGMVSALRAKAVVEMSGLAENLVEEGNSWPIAELVEGGMLLDRVSASMSAVDGLFKSIYTLLSIWRCCKRCQC